MNTNKRKISILGAVIVFICLFSSCVIDKARNSIVMDSAKDSIVMDSARDYIVIDLAKDPCVMDYVRNDFFVNCTNDTLFICPSHCNDIDSIYDRAFPLYSQSRCMDDYVLLEVNGLYIHNNEAIFPDSTCWTNYYKLRKTDTAYFFLIKWSDAKRYSWDEIREQKLYRKWIVTRDKDGNYDTNIRYSDSDEQE